MRIEEDSRRKPIGEVMSGRVIKHLGKFWMRCRPKHNTSLSDFVLDDYSLMTDLRSGVVQGFNNDTEVEEFPNAKFVV